MSLFWFKKNKIPNWRDLIELVLVGAIPQNFRYCECERVKVSSSHLISISISTVFKIKNKLYVGLHSMSRYLCLYYLLCKWNYSGLSHSSYVCVIIWLESNIQPDKPCILGRKLWKNTGGRSAGRRIMSGLGVTVTFALLCCVENKG